MRYDYKQKETNGAPVTLTDCVRVLDECSVQNMNYLRELIKLSEKCGLDEMTGYLRKSMNEMERSVLWMRVQLPFWRESECGK